MNRIAAIVPVRDGGEDLGRCIAGLRGAGLGSDSIVIVDDGSIDGAAEHLARQQGIARVAVPDGPRGPAAARNLGARQPAAMAADTLLFVDADVVLHADAIDRFDTCLQANPMICAAFGSYDDRPPAPGLVSQYKNLLHHYMHQRGDTDASTFWSGCGVVRRDVFHTMGGFDPRYTTPSIEDIDLGMRLRDAGHRIALCPDVLCTHLKRWTLFSWLRTDVLARALPWSRLLAERREGIPDTLNLGLRERVSAVCVWVLLLSLAATLMVPAAALVAGVGLGVFVLLQWPLLSFFYRQRGAGFTFMGCLLHLLYFALSSVVFVLVQASVRGGLLKQQVGSGALHGGLDRQRVAAHDRSAPQVHGEGGDWQQQQEIER